MCLEKYTLEHRNLGQAAGAHKVGASERCSQNPPRGYGVPENACHFWGERSDLNLLRAVLFVQSASGLRRYGRFYITSKLFGVDAECANTI